MINIAIEGFGIVREPGRSPHPVYYITVSQPAHAASWTVYRGLAAFRTLSDGLRELIPGLRPCPNPLPGSVQGMAGLTGSTVDNLTVQGLHGGAQQLQAWLQHARLFPAVEETSVYRAFCLDAANVP
ncbi:hypothetical protein NGA_0729000, partial [Nannochloropsis gaditana CCMP526]